MVFRLLLQISVLRKTLGPLIVHCCSFLYARRHEPLFQSLVYCILASTNQSLRMGLEQTKRLKQAAKQGGFPHISRFAQRPSGHFSGQSLDLVAVHCI
jgi:hypothetical protein